MLSIRRISRAPLLQGVLLGLCSLSACSTEIGVTQRQAGGGSQVQADHAAQKVTASAPKAVKISSTAQLIGGPAAQGRVGDYLLSNDHVRAIIQAPGEDAGPAPFGGTLIDADIVRANGAPGQDAFGEVSLFLNMALTMRATTVSVLDDGAVSGIAKVQACGKDYLYDFLDFSTMLDDIPFSSRLVPYDFNEIFGLNICTTYSLAANDRYVTMSTTISNPTSEDIFLPVGDILDCGGDVEPFTANPTGEKWAAGGKEYVYGGFGAQYYAPLDFLGFFGQGVSYAYAVPLGSDGQPAAFQASVAGVAVTVLDTTRIIKVVRGKERFLTELPAGKSVSFTRSVVIGEDLSAVTDEVYRMRNKAVGTLQGTVRETTTNTPLPNVRVTVLGKAGLIAPITQLYTDSKGFFQASLPAGDYGLIAAEGFDFMSDARPELQTPVNFTVKASTTTTQDLTMPRNGAVSLTVTDGLDTTGNTLLPAKVMFFGADTTPPVSALMDVSDDMVGRAGLARMFFLTQGTATITLKPGSYDVVFSRGFEYDVKVIKGLVVSSGQVATAKASLTRVLDTTGYLSADFHVHSVNSPDSPVPLERRLASFLSEGVEVLVATDHDFVTDYRPVIDAAGADDYVTTLAGDEITTFASGHLISFPLEVDSASRTGGAINWMSDTGSCLSFPAASEIQDNPTVPQLFEIAQTCHAQGAKLVRQVNHPRGSFQGYFSQIGLNLAALGTANEVSAEPITFRMPDGSDLFDPRSFNVIEILNGTSISHATTNMNDWFGLLNLGYNMGASAVSDTHTEVRDAAGYGRSYVKVSPETPAQAHASSTFPQDFATAAIAGKITSGIGPFVTVSAAPTAGGTSAGMGELVPSTSGKATLKVRIQSPSWVSYKRVDVYVNPVVYANADDASYIDPTGLSPAQTWCNTVTDDGSCRSASTYAGTFTPASVAVGTSGAARGEANLTIPLVISKDAWVVVVVWGGQIAPYTGYTNTPIVFTSPLYLDANNDGLYTAPCANYSAQAGCAYLRPVGERPSTIVSADRLMDPEAEELQSIYETLRRSFVGRGEVQ